METEMLLFSSDEKNYVQVQKMNLKKVSDYIKFIEKVRVVMHRKLLTSLIILEGRGVVSSENYLMSPHVIFSRSFFRLPLSFASILSFFRRCCLYRGVKTLNYFYYTREIVRFLTRRCTISCNL